MDVFATPFTLALPPTQRAPVIVASPHSGRHYPAAFLAASRLDARAIRRSEDSFVDELFAAAPSLGLPLLAANFPRAYCDVNREAWELDPAMFEDKLPDYVNCASPRVSAGLGTVARIVGTGEPIYRAKLKFAEAEERIARCWRPYHAQLHRLIDNTMARFGVCLLLDCHSMPTLPHQRPGRMPELVLGDVHATSCAPLVTGFAEACFAHHGLRVRRNDPYAGGYVTRHYGRPREGVHALQIELSRGLYMDEANFTRSARFAGLATILGTFLAELAETASLLLPAASRPAPPPLASAAE